MTVAELIAILSKFDPRARVLLEGENNDAYDIELETPIVTIAARKLEVKQ